MCRASISTAMASVITVCLLVSFINMRDCFMNGRRSVSLIYCVAQYTSISFLFEYYHLSNVVRVLCYFVDANSTLINELHSYIARALISDQLYRVRAAATNEVEAYIVKRYEMNLLNVLTFNSLLEHAKKQT